MQITRAEGPDFTYDKGELTLYLHVNLARNLTHLEGPVTVTLSAEQMEHFTWNARNVMSNISALLNDFLSAFPNLTTRDRRDSQEADEPKFPTADVGYLTREDVDQILDMGEPDSRPKKKLTDAELRTVLVRPQPPGTRRSKDDMDQLLELMSDDRLQLHFASRSRSNLIIMLHGGGKNWRVVVSDVQSSSATPVEETSGKPWAIPPHDEQKVERGMEEAFAEEAEE